MSNSGTAADFLSIVNAFGEKGALVCALKSMFQTMSATVFSFAPRLSLATLIAATVAFSSVGTKLYASSLQKSVAKSNTPIPEVSATSAAQKIDRKNALRKRKPWFTPRRTALLIGIALLLMAVAGGVAASITGGLFVAGNVAQTALNVSQGVSRFNGAVAGWGITWLLDILTSVGVIGYFREKKPKLAWLSGGLRLGYSAVLGGAIVQLLRLNPAGPASQIFNHLQTFSNLWGAGLIVFGLHLIALGVLFNPEGGKKWVKWGIKGALIVAGLGYVIEQVGALFVPNPAAFVASLQPVFIIPMIVGEVAFAIWMIAKGGKKPKSAGEMPAAAQE